MRKDARADRTYLVVGKAEDAEMRHRIACDARGMFMFIHVPEGGDHVVCPATEAVHVREGRAFLGSGVDVLTLEELGLEGFATSLRDRKAAELMCYAEACRRVGVKGVVAVPSGFPAQAADFLRGRGLGVKIDDPFFSLARRMKTASERDGIMRAQRAAEHAFAVVSDAMFRAEAGEGGVLTLDGAVLTCRRLMELADGVFRDHGCRDGGESTVSRGGRTAEWHAWGDDGAIVEGEPVVIGLRPVDDASGCGTSLARTLVKGSPSADIARCHALVVKALEHMGTSIRAGVKVRTLRRSAAKVMLGYDDLSVDDGTADEGGFALIEDPMHSIGHGVGLEPFEPPFVDALPGAFEDGDIVALEPGCAHAGDGGVVVSRLIAVGGADCKVLDECPTGLEPAPLAR